MATTFVEYTGDGNATKQFTFPSYQSSDVKVRVDGDLKTSGTHYNITDYTTTGGGNIVFIDNSGSGGTNHIPSSPANIRIYRDTNVDVAKATYTPGSSIRAADLTNNQTQLLYRSQEEQTPNLIQSYDIDASGIETSNIKDGAVTTAKIAADAVTGAKIADDQIGSEHYAPLSVNTAAIANEDVTTAKLDNNAVTTSKIENLNVTRAKLEPDAVDGTKLADNAVNTEHYTDNSIQHVHLQNDIIDGDNIQDDAIDSEHYTDGSIDTAHIANNAVTAAKIADATIVTTAEQAGHSVNNITFFTTAASDARYFNISSGDTIKDGDTFPDNDTSIATTAAINDRIIDLVDDVGGFVPIANETSFPTANPDVNNGSGTLVSIKSISSSRTPSSGTVTIADGAGSGNTVTITGCGSTVLAAGFGVIVETTSTLHTYAFHRLVPKATEVTTVASNTTQIGTVHTNINNINTVAGISSDVTAVKNIASDVTAVKNIASNVTAVANDATDIGIVAADETDIGLVAGSIDNVNTAATNIASINNASSNINSVNNFGDTYQVASSNPSTDGGGNALAEGDLYFNTNDNELKVYNGSSWQAGITATSNNATLGSNTFTADQTIQDESPAITFTDNAGTINDPDYKLQVNNGRFIIHDKTNNVTRFLVKSDGTVDVSGNLDVGAGLDVLDGNISMAAGHTVDGRDVSADGTKLDLINLSSTNTFDGQLVSQSTTGGGSTGLKVTNGTEDFVQYFEGSGANGSYVMTYVGSGGTDLRFAHNGEVQLRHGGQEKFATSSTGASLTGNLDVSNGIDVTGTLNITSGNFTCTGSLNTGNELNFTGNSAKFIDFETLDGSHRFELRHHDPTAGTFETAIKATANGAIDLFYDTGTHTTPKLSTTDSGIKVDRIVTIDGSTPRIEMKVTGDAQSHRLEFYNAANSMVSRIYGDPSGDLEIQTGSGGNQKAIKVNSGGAVDLHHNGSSSPKLSTSATGVTVSGTATVTQDLNVGTGIAVTGGIGVSTGNEAGLSIVDNSSSNHAPWIEVIGKRLGSNNSQAFSGKLHLAINRTDAKINNGKVLGAVAFGGNHTDGSLSNTLYAASISGVASDSFDSATDMPTDLVFFTGSTGRAPNVPNVSMGDESMRITADGTVGIGSNAPTAPLDVARLGSAWTGAAPTAGTVAHLHNGNNGASSPAYLGLGAGNQSISGINFGDDGDADAGKITYSHVDDSLRFQTNTQERARISSAGNFGIGTLSPNRMLHIVSNGTSKIALTDSDITAEANSLVGGIDFTTTDSDDPGISAQIGAYHEDQAGNAYLKFNTGNASNAPERMRIKSDGTVDIAGNLDVGAGLDVTGNVTATGTISGTLADGVTATTQSANDNSTKVATTAYVDNASGGGGSASTLVSPDGTTKVEATNSSVEVKDSFRIDDSSPSFSLRNANGSTYLGQISHSGGTHFNIHNRVAGGDFRLMATSGTSGTYKILFRNTGGGTGHPDVYIGQSMISTEDGSGNGKPTGLNAMFPATGGVELYHISGSTGTKKFETTADGVTITGDVIPSGTCDLGSTSARWDNVYTNDLHLSNEGHSNDVDGSWGDWTIQEGESDLFLKNNRSGKKYKFNLTEVS